MTGTFKMIAMALIALAGFVGYTYVFARVLGVNTDDAIVVLATGNASQQTFNPSDSAGPMTRDGAWISNLGLSTGAESPDSQMIIIEHARAQLESLKVEVRSLIEIRNEQENERLDNLAEIYNDMIPVQLVHVMQGIPDSVIVQVLPRMDKRKAGKVLESMPPQRAAVISSKLLKAN